MSAPIALAILQKQKAKSACDLWFNVVITMLSMFKSRTMHAPYKYGKFCLGLTRACLGIGSATASGVSTALVPHCQAGWLAKNFASKTWQLVAAERCDDEDNDLNPLRWAG